MALVFRLTRPDGSREVILMQVTYGHCGLFQTSGGTDSYGCDLLHQDRIIVI